MPSVCGAAAVVVFRVWVFSQKVRYPVVLRQAACLGRWVAASRGDAEGKSPFWEGASPVLGKVVSDIVTPQFNGAGTKTASSSPGNSGKHQGYHPLLLCQWF